MEQAVAAETVFSDRSQWGQGPWDSEPMDKTQWIDPATGLDCMTVRNPAGAWCGYVGVPLGHPLYGADFDSRVIIPGDVTHLGTENKGVFPIFLASMEYDENNPHETRLDAVLECHGGLTYSGKCQGHICHVPEEGRPDNVWWLGFDCIHSGDMSPKEDMPIPGEVYRPLEYVQAQCTHLAAQLCDTDVRQAPVSTLC